MERVAAEQIAPSATDEAQVAEIERVAGAVT